MEFYGVPWKPSWTCVEFHGIIMEYLWTLHGSFKYRVSWNVTQLFNEHQRVNYQHKLFKVGLDTCPGYLDTPDTCSCPGYLGLCLLTSTAYLISQNFLVRNGSQDMPVNLFTVFVGPPGTGKSQALKEGALQPMADVRAERDWVNTIIEKCTSSALVKSIADNKKAFIISLEVFEVLRGRSSSLRAFFRRKFFILFRN